MHDKDPAAALYELTAHGAQFGEPVVHVPLVPAGHALPQVAAPGPLHDPVGHAKHAPLVAL